MENAAISLDCPCGRSFPIQGAPGGLYGGGGGGGGSGNQSGGAGTQGIIRITYTDRVHSFITIVGG